MHTFVRQDTLVRGVSSIGKATATGFASIAAPSLSNKRKKRRSIL